MSLKYWNNIYNSVKEIKLNESEWLDQYLNIISESRNKPIIDLGCGSGSDSIHLLNKGYSVISCDFSREILDKLVSYDSRIIPKQFNIQNGLPFSNSEAHIILASLSLHYFDWITTIKVISEIERVLDSDGYLICRLNSVNDINHGAGQGIEIEKNFYNFEGNYKRFFDKAAIEKLFSNWKIIINKECEIKRFRKPKKVWEIVVKK